jgi:putative endonuclease
MAPPGEAGKSERGRAAEALAEAWLRRSGFEILARNHSTRRGEVDLVCREQGVLCFVEVRSRSSDRHGAPAETVTRAKARRVVLAATDWALSHGGLDQPMRFDLVAVLTAGGRPQVTLIRGAFDAAGNPVP